MKPTSLAADQMIPDVELLPLPPGPKGLPFLGSLLDRKRDSIGFFKKTAEEYGDVCRYRLGPIKVTMISHPDFVKTLLMDTQSNFKKGRAYDLLRILLGDGLLTAEGEKWKANRKLAQPMFHQKNLMGLVDVMNSCTQTTISQWKPGAQIDMAAEMMKLTLDIVIRTILGSEIDKKDIQTIGSELTIALNLIHGIFFSTIPLPPSIPTYKSLRLKLAVRRMERVVYKIIEARKKDKRTHNDLLQTLLDAQEGNFSNKQLRDEIMTFLLAGHETTATALSWTVYLLTQNNEVRDKIKAEVDAVLGSEPPTFEKISKLKYTSATLEEGMRHYPPVYILMRDAVKEVQFGPYRVPKGDAVTFSTTVLHKDSRWWKNPEEFRPERFLNGHPEFDNNRPKFAYLPFSSGPRNCIGAPFAMMEGTLILALICQKFSFTLAPGAVIDKEPAVTLRAKYGIPVTLKLS